MKQVITFFILWGCFSMLWTSCQKDTNTQVSGDTFTHNGIEYNKLTGLSQTQDALFDFRDSNVYAVMEVDSQMWFAENLRHKTGVFIENPNNPSSNYGLLYNWATTMNNASASGSIPSNVQGVCPNGWHVPSYLEFDKLVDKFGFSAGAAMKSTTGWLNNGNGDNTSKYNALPAGWAYSSNYVGLGETAMYWTTTDNPYDRNWVSMIAMKASDRYVTKTDTLLKTYMASCRCMKD